MAKTSKDDGSKLHTVETLTHTATQIDRLLADVRYGLSMMQALQVAELAIPLERSRSLGLVRLRAWADAIRDAADHMSVPLDLPRTANGNVPPAAPNSKKKRKERNERS